MKDKNIIRITSFCLVIMFLIGTISFAATDEQITRGQQLVKLNIFKGYEDGDLRLENNITRAEIATILIRINNLENTTVDGASKISFKDVSSKFWAIDNIRKCAKLGYVKGYSDKTFKPNENISYAEMITMMVRIAGKDKNLKGDWPYNYLDRAKEVGIIKLSQTEYQNMKNDSNQTNHKVTRGEVATLIWNTINVNR